MADLGVRKIRLITNNPAKRVGLEGYGLEIVERVPIEVPPNPYNMRYLETKRDKLGHLIQVGDSPAEPPSVGEGCRRFWDRSTFEEVEG